MQTKLKFSAILLTLFFAIMPLTAITANAMTFDLRIPSFGLYCENQNADIHGKIKYVIDENGKAVQYAEYTVKGANELNVNIPFISNAYELPQIDITVNQKVVTGKICYGENYFRNGELHFYSTDIDGSITGTLYRLTTANESLTVDFKTYDKQSIIYLLPYNRFSQTSNGEYSYTLDIAQPTSTYEIYALNGDLEKFETNAATVKETITLKEYIDRNYNELNEYYSTCGNIKAEFFYSLANKMLENNINYDFFDFFFDSISEHRINAYKIDLQINAETCTIAYSMPVDVQKNTTFKPAIYLTEHTATGNYNVDYTIELNSELPFIIESSTEIKKQSENVYTAENITDDFYFVFSASEKPKSIYGNDNGNGTLNIVLFCLLGVAVCVFIVSTTILIISFIKNRKQRKENK